MPFVPVLLVTVTLAIPILARFRGALRFLCLVINKLKLVVSTAAAASASSACS